MGSWRDLVNRFSEENQPDPLDEALADHGHEVTKNVSAVHSSLERAGGYATVEALRDNGPIGRNSHQYWYGVLPPFFREELPDDVVRPVGGVTVDVEGAIDAGYLEYGRHDTRLRVTDEFDAHAVTLAENSPVASDDAYWQLQYLYRNLGESAPMHEYEVVYEAARIQTVVSRASPFPSYLRLSDGTEYRQLVAEERWGDFEHVRHELLTELPGVVEADEFYLAVPDAEPPIDTPAVGSDAQESAGAAGGDAQEGAS